MQGKNIVKFFAAFLFLICAYQLFLLYPTNNIEDKARRAADKEASYAAPKDRDSVKVKAEQRFLDSISKKKILNLGIVSYTYEELKKQQLALGLDLKGGMSAVLQVNLADFVDAMATDKGAYPQFQPALARARQLQASSQSDFITLFGQAYKELTNGQALAPIFAMNPAVSGKLTMDSKDDQVLKVLRELAGETVNTTYDRLKKRIDKVGVVQPSIYLDTKTDRINVELPGVKNPKRVEEMLKASAKLEFWETFFLDSDGSNGDQTQPDDIALADAVKTLNKQLGLIERGDSTMLAIIKNDTTSNDSLAATDPLYRIGVAPMGGAIWGAVEAKDTSIANKLLSSPAAKRLLPSNVKFLWDAQPFKDKNDEFGSRYYLYAIKVRGNGQAPLEGDVVTDARRETSTISGGNTVNITMNDDGARKWANLTGVNVNRIVAVVLDDRVYSAPNVMSKIEGGRTEISGTFSATEADDLATVLKVGKLPASIEIIEKAVVGPSLGKDTINAGLMSLVAGFLLVLLFMVFYYGMGGVISVIALLANMFFIIGSLSSFGAVLTLPGIAGIVLTLGMAVDANVIIYERAKEALREGKSMVEAIKEGYNGSMAAIIDSNITTLITALVLMVYGLGPLKGFGVVLSIGIVCSVFSAVLLSRIVVEWWMAKNWNLTLWTGGTKDILSHVNYDFVGKRKIFYGLSLLIMLAGVASFFSRGFELGVDMKGGRTYTLLFNGKQSVNASDVQAKFSSLFVENGKSASTLVKEFDKPNQVMLTTSYLQESTDPKADEQVLEKVKLGIEAVMGSPVSDEEFNGDTNPTKILQRESKVGATIADDIRNSAFTAALIALLGIFLYILIRFRKWQFSLGAVIALIHDVLIVLSLFSILHGILPFPMEIDSAFVAAILTVIGYSVNDTVIVFDRIREFMLNYKHKPINEVVNDAINSTISRTTITSLTTMLAIIILFFFGGAGIKAFSFAMLIGIISGTYSSIFIATPIMLDLSKDKKAFEYLKKAKKDEEETI